MSEEKKTIAVVGSTGSQGGALVKAILEDSTFAVRALTRDPSKKQSSALKAAGANVIKFDLDDPSTHASALDGVYGLFVVTNFWEHMDPDRETEQAKAVSASAQKAGVAHIVWSTLEDTSAFFDSLSPGENDKLPPKIKGRYVPHFEGKAAADSFFPPSITTRLYTSCYLEVICSPMMIHDGVLGANMGDVPLPVVAIDDIGKIALGIFKNREQYVGQSCYAVSDKLPCNELMDILSTVTGKDFRYQAMDRADYAGLGFPGAEDLANMFHYQLTDPAFNANRDKDEAKLLNSDIMDANTWVESKKDELVRLAA